VRKHVPVEVKKIMDDLELRSFVKTYDAEQREDEVVWFYRHAEKINPKVIVEIGTKEGGNSRILSTLLPKDGLIIGIDPKPGAGFPWVHEVACQVEFVSGRSLVPAVVDQVKNILSGRPIDLLFIDGEHSFGGMLGDYHVYGGLVRPGGIIAIHDIYYLEKVKMAWEGIPGEKFASFQNQSSIGIGFVFK